jgi:hypothetical protein
MLPGGFKSRKPLLNLGFNPKKQYMTAGGMRRLEAPRINSFWLQLPGVTNSIE